MIPPFHANHSFHAQHSPQGAFFSFTMGLAARRGGIAAELGRPANQELFIGFKDGTLHAPGTCVVFPFNETATEDISANFVGTPPPEDPNQKLDIKNLKPADYLRRYGLATDSFETDTHPGTLSFRVYTPYVPLPDPATASSAQLRDALLPAVFAELTLDNTRGQSTKTIFFALRFDTPGARILRQGLPEGTVGFAWKRSLGFAATPSAGNLHPFMRWTVTNALADRDNPIHLLGNNPGVALEVPPGQSRTIRIALGCHLDGTVTTGLAGSYFYTRYYRSIEEVLDAALAPARFDAAKSAAAKLDAQLLSSGLSPDQQFLIAHSVRSYHGSTQLLDVGGQPFWIVNEGEYCMLNTLDLSVDHVFFELAHNPWVVKNLLNNFVRHYSYVDTVGAPGEPKTRPGGISFCHDMGVNNQFSPPAHSSYELTNLDALCFSHMTAEQLCNWLLIAATYVRHTRDTAWAREYRHVVEACGDSLLNRCGAGGIIAFDSSRCGPNGAEITTYDSLDHSLAQTRNNLYMATKGWAAFLAVRELLLAADDAPADETPADDAPADKSPAREAPAPGSPTHDSSTHDSSAHHDAPSHDNWLRYAHAAGETVRQQAGRDGILPPGILPAVFEPNNPGFKSQILPAIEGLVYPIAWGSSATAEHGPFASLLACLKTHTLACLASGANHFPDAGIRLSSTSGNSWLSKIFLFQHVCRTLGWQTSADFAKADAAHVHWLTTGDSAYWAMSDQIVDGVAKGSKYYPRCVTNWLWLAPTATQG